MAESASPKSTDPMIQKLSEFLEAELRQRSDNFCIQNEALQSDEIASHDGLLSLFMFKAAECCEEAMKRRLPLFFESDTSALIDVIPKTEPGDFNLFSLWSHFLHYSVEEEVRRYKREKKLINGLVPLDDLYRRWHHAVSHQRYAIRPASRPQAPAGQGPASQGQGA